MNNREAQTMKKEPVYNTKTALAVANAIYRKKGYVKTTEADYGERKSNKTLVLEELAKATPKYAKKDLSFADEIVEHYQGLLLFKLGDTQNSFQEAVLSCVAQDNVKARDIGIIASLPHTYKTTLDKEARKSKEEAMASKSSFTGNVKKRNIFDIVVEMVKPLPHKGLYIVSFMQGDNILKHFTPSNPEDDGIVEGANLQISAYVKDHQVNKYNGGKETIINRIKVLKVK